MANYTAPVPNDSQPAEDLSLVPVWLLTAFHWFSIESALNARKSTPADLGRSGQDMVEPSDVPQLSWCTPVHVLQHCLAHTGA